MSRRSLAASALLLALALAGCGGGGASKPPRFKPGPPGTPPALGSLAAGGAGHRFYEIYEPSGPVHGTMLMLHGGSFMDSPGMARSNLASVALVFRNLGWRVVNVAYTPAYGSGGRGLVAMLRDVVAFYDQIHRAFGGPICAYGESAGGDLAALLAVERPSLRCAILNAAPLDLVTLRGQTNASGVSILKTTFGTNRSFLAQWSPTLLWNPAKDHTAVFATAAANDTLVPAVQDTEFGDVDRAADTGTLPGSAPGYPGAVPFMHSFVDDSAFLARFASLKAWLNRIVPSTSGATPSANTGADCSSPNLAGWQLMLAGDAWQQSSTGGLGATRGCSGSAASQEDGLSLWALPSTTSQIPSGATALLTLTGSVHNVSVSFRGFLAHPRDWDLGLYASTSTAGTTGTEVAGCNLGRCSGGLGLVRTPTGALVTSAGSTADPDASAIPPNAGFTLPAGTRRIAWVLSCAASGGCPVQGIRPAGKPSPRPRDPLGQPAVFSLYRIDLG